MTYNYKMDRTIINQICEERPAPDRRIDQVHMKTKSIINQLNHLKSYVYNKDVVLLGDDDFLSVAISLFLSPKSVTLFELDSRIIKAIKEQNKKYELNIRVIKYDAIKEAPTKYRGKYDFFITNPPYGSKNKGKSGCVFIYRCLQMCKPKSCGCFILPYSRKLKWSIKAMSNIQKFIKKMGCVLIDVNYAIHKYYHENQNLTSSSFIINKIKNDGVNCNFKNVQLY